MKLHVNNKSHYSTNHTKYLPKGMGIDIFETSKLIQLKNHHLTKYDQEHLNSFFIKNKKKFKTIFYRVNKKVSLINLSIDTFNDYKFIKKNYPLLKNVKSNKGLKNFKLML